MKAIITKANQEFCLRLRRVQEILHMEWDQSSLVELVISLHGSLETNLILNSQVFMTMGRLMELMVDKITTTLQV